MLRLCLMARAMTVMHTYGKFTRCCSARWKFRKDHWESGWPSVSEEHVFDAGVDASITYLVAGNFFFACAFFFRVLFFPPLRSFFS